MDEQKIQLDHQDDLGYLMEQVGAYLSQEWMQQQQQQQEGQGQGQQQRTREQQASYEQLRKMAMKQQQLASASASAGDGDGKKQTTAAAPSLDLLPPPLQKIVKDVFYKGVAPNIQLNGFDWDPTIEDENLETFEAFDDTLYNQVKQLQSTLDATLVRVTALRRSVPQQVQEAWKEVQRRQVGLDSAFLRDQRGQGQEVQMQMEAGEGFQDRDIVEAQASLENSLHYLADLKKSTPSVAAKLERAQEILHEHVAHTILNSENQSPHAAAAAPHAKETLTTTTTRLPQPVRRALQPSVNGAHP